MDACDSPRGLSMRVLLINPPYPRLEKEPKSACPPLGLAYMAGALETHGHEVQIMDCVIEGYETESVIADGTLVY